MSNKNKKKHRPQSNYKPNYHITYDARPPEPFNPAPPMYRLVTSDKPKDAYEFRARWKRSSWWKRIFMLPRWLFN